MNPNLSLKLHFFGVTSATFACGLVVLGQGNSRHGRVEDSKAVSFFEFIELFCDSVSDITRNMVEELIEILVRYSVNGVDYAVV